MDPRSVAKLLVVDDDQGMRDMLVSHLQLRSFEVVAVASAAEALAACRGDFDVVIADVHMPGTTGVELCTQLVARWPALPVILVTAYGTMDTAIEAMRAGAYDFVPKPFRIEQLVMAIRRAANVARLEHRVQRLQHAVAPTSFGQLVGTSPVMTELYGLLARIAGSSAPVLITGETGTGKELVVRAIHAGGQRPDGPLVAVNCAAMPAALLESELFGHARGAFTDAREAKHGLFVAANGGTLFLDEVGDLPLELQPKLLRAIQERTVRPVGATAELPFDARIVAATHRDLAAMCDAGTFRQDLLFRLDVVPIAVPPLRARGGDVMLLASHFLDRFATAERKRIVGFTPEAAQQLAGYPWPGNVRELENCVECAVALATADRIALADLPDKVRAARSTELVPGVDAASLVTLDELERRYVRRVLDAVSGNKSAAARVLGIERRTLYRMLHRS